MTIIIKSQREKIKEKKKKKHEEIQTGGAQLNFLRLTYSNSRCDYRHPRESQEGWLG